MKTHLAIATATLMALPMAANAGIIAPAPSGPSFMLGVSIGFGGGTMQPALSAHVLTGRSDVVGGLGAHWYPMATGNQFGLGLGLGFVSGDFGFVGGYDFINNSFTAGGGYVAGGSVSEPDCSSNNTFSCAD